MEKLGNGKVAVYLVLLTVLGTWLSGAQMPGWARAAAVVLAVLGTVVAQHGRRLLNVVRALPRDLWFLRLYARVLRVMKRFERENASVVGVLEERAQRTPDEPCFLFESRTWTFKNVNDYSNRLARALQRVGVARGDILALVLDNCVEYVCVWLAAAKLGAVTALINRNLRDVPLAHTINAARTKVVLFGREYADGIDGVRGELRGVESFFQFGGGSGGVEAHWFRDILPLMDKESTDKPVVDFTPKFDDPIMYIYTSGTTGLPKAAIITNAKVMGFPLGIMRACDLRPVRDVHYCPLPLYHAAAGACAASLALVHGVTVVLTPKFSASKFWADCVKYKATSAQYIGELCRFLVLSPESPYDRQHGVRVLLGNGMSPGIWRRVQERFGVLQIAELYGSTEGNILIVNVDGKVGAIGFVPLLLPRSLWPLDVVRVDAETNEPIRDDLTGLCIPCNYGEPGMIIGKIRQNVIHSRFVGYLDRQATEKKILTDVFDLGDRYFLSGDLVVMDEMGYLYFKDRTGDTYRWKGENVSTAEVEAAMTRVLLPQGVREVAVYGVQVPGHEGRAGMAAIADPDRRADLRLLAEQLTKCLPAYERPVFLRVSDALPMTGTHKVSKVLLQREGFLDVPATDCVHVFDSRAGTYLPLSVALLENIRENKLRI